MVEMSFRPLAGITVFRTGQVLTYTVGLTNVSVPWRGLRSFGLDDLPLLRQARIRFPSPGGDYGLSDLKAEAQALCGEVEFPSPGGDYGLSDCRAHSRHRSSCMCFRPLAGITVFRTR